MLRLYILLHFLFLLSINAVIAQDDGENVPPTITGQVPLQTTEEQSLTLDFSHFTVSDPDDSYPEGFTMAVAPGTNYSISGTTVSPATDYTGPLSVNVTVNDGENNSAPFAAQIEVTSVNDPPVITGQVPLQINEDEPLTIALSHLTVSDPDNVYPNDFSLAVGVGDNYTVSGTTITPATGFSGTLSVNVTVSDGVNTSAPFALQVQVAAQNDAPVIVGQAPLQTNEDQAVTIELTHLSVTDSDNSYPTGFSLSLGAGANYSLSGNTVVPAADFSGTLSIPVTVNDGQANSAPFNFQLTVTAVNDPPVITGQSSLQTGEGQAITLALSHFTVADPDNSYPSGFTLNVSSGDNYTVSGTTVTPAADFSGALVVPVTVSDGTNSSAFFNAQILVNAVNNAPVITGQQPVQTNEDTPVTLELGHLIVSDPDNSFPTGFTMKVLPGTNYSVSGNTVTPAANFSGTLTVGVTVNDGAAESASFPFQISVVPANDPPVITGQSPISIYRDQSIVLSLLNLSVSDPDNVYPNEHTLSVGAGDNYTVVGTMVTPAAGFTGTLSVNVSVFDPQNGSNVFPLKIQVLVPPNVAPVITGQVTLTTFENQPITLQLSHLLVSDPDNVFPDDFILSVRPGSNYTLNGNTVVPANNFSGTLTVPVQVRDRNVWSTVFNLSVQVVPVNEVPLITSQTFLSVPEGGTITLTFDDLVVIDTDNQYPNGFTLNVLAGEHYTTSGTTITPETDFNGYLTVPVTVSDGANTSTPYNVVILVEPVNDAPVITNLETAVLRYGVGKGALTISETLEIEDVDDDTLSFAEVAFDSISYEAGDTLIFNNTSVIRGIFDARTGILALIGRASLIEYRDALRSVQYSFTKTEPLRPNKIIYITVNDGKNESDEYQRQISLADEVIALDIPDAFTPNGDFANDTWKIKPVQGNETFTNAIVRVYNKRGQLVYEASGFDHEWDGSLNGALLPADTYFYTIDLNITYTKSKYKGIVMLLR
jgi:gliding motility-associated-like protein